MKVFVKMQHGLRIDFDLAATDSFASVKRMVEERTSIPVDQQRLVAEGKEMWDEDQLGEMMKNLSSSTLYLVPRYRASRMQVFVKLDWQLGGKTLTLEVVQSDTIGALKARIHRQENIPYSPSTVLIYAGKKLAEYQSLSYYDIRKEGVLHLTIEQQSEGAKGGGGGGDGGGNALEKDSDYFTQDVWDELADLYKNLGW